VFLDKNDDFAQKEEFRDVKSLGTSSQGASGISEFGFPIASFIKSGEDQILSFLQKKTMAANVMVQDD